MSFQNTVANWLSADGIPAVYASNINLNNNVAVALPGPTIATNFSPIRPRAGYVRVKSGGVGVRGNVTTKVGPIVATDGTNTTNIYAGDAAATSNNIFYDSTFFFWLDWGVANINITNISTVNNSQTYDVEVAGMM
jgi:hypothetical protein